jgi:hypothetical protein
MLPLYYLVGNVEYLPKKSSYHHDESVLVRNPEIVRLISGLLRVTEETLLAALTSKRARVSGEMLVINYRMPEVSWPLVWNYKLSWHHIQQGSKNIFFNFFSF